jgi:hypothetical protein
MIDQHADLDCPVAFKPILDVPGGPADGAQLLDFPAQGLAAVGDTSQLPDLPVSAPPVTSLAHTEIMGGGGGGGSLLDCL